MRWLAASASTGSFTRCGHSPYPLLSTGRLAGPPDNGPLFLPSAAQDLVDLEESVRSLNPKIQGFESSCFSGCYLTPEIDAAYLRALEEARDGPAPHAPVPGYAADISEPPPANGAATTSSSSTSAAAAVAVAVAVAAVAKREGPGNCEGLSNGGDAKKTRAESSSSLLA